MTSVDTKHQLRRTCASGWTLGALLVLALLAFTSSLRPWDDSYAHYAVSVQAFQSLDWHVLLFDTWNKPLPGLIFGFAGLAGISCARLASVIITVGMGILLIRLLRRSVAGLDALHPAVWIGVLLCQQAVFPQSYLTMTDLIAAFLMVAGLYAWVSTRPVLAVLLVGLMPFARIEGMFVAAWCLLCMGLHAFLGDRKTGKRYLRSVSLMVIGALPGMVWWAAGAWVNGDPAWFKASYAFLRPLAPISDLLLVNAVTALPSVVTPLQLILLLLGCYGLFAARHTLMATPSSRLVICALLGSLLLHMAFMSAIVVYPKGTGLDTIDVSAINARNFNMVAPALAVLMCLGISQLANPSSRRQSARTLLRTGVLVAILVILGHAGFNLRKLGEEYRSLVGLQFRQLIMIGLVGAGILAVGAHRATALGLAERTMMISRWSCILCVLALPLTSPAFWYPLKMHDHASANQREFGLWLDAYADTASCPRIVQDMNGQLGFFIGHNTPDMPWSYPDLMLREANRVPTHSLVVIETDASAAAHSRYPQALMLRLQDESVFTLLADVRAVKKTSWLQDACNLITPYNRPGGFRVYIKEGEVTP